MNSPDEASNDLHHAGNSDGGLSSNGAPASTSRKRKATASGRGVASLTPDQVKHHLILVAYIVLTTSTVSEEESE